MSNTRQHSSEMRGMFSTKCSSKSCKIWYMLYILCLFTFEKKEKNRFVDFLILHKKEKNLKHFTRSFIWTQTSYFWKVAETLIFETLKKLACLFMRICTYKYIQTELGTILFFVIYNHSWSFCQTMIYNHSRS